MEEGEGESFFPLEGSEEALAQKVQPIAQYAPVGRSEVTLLEAMLFLRNALAHGALAPSSEKCQEVLDHYLPVLDRTLEAFGFLTAGEWLFREQEPPDVWHTEVRVRRLRGATLPDPEWLPLDEALQEGFAQSEMVLRTEKGVFPLYPLFYGRDVHECPLYEGHFVTGTSKGIVRYLGVYSSYDEEATFDALRESLERRQVPWWLSKEETAPWSLYDSTRYYSQQTLEELLGQKYFPETYLEREELRRHLEAFLAEGEKDITQPERRDTYRNGLLLLGEAGSGKTAWCAHLVNRLLREGLDEESSPTAEREKRGRNLVFFIRGDTLDVSADRSLFEEVVKRMGVRVQAVDATRGHATTPKERESGFITFADLLKQLDSRWRDDKVRQDRRFVLVLDALNECKSAEQALRETLELISAAKRYPWCKVIASLRSEFLAVFRARREGSTAADPFDSYRPFLYIAEEHGERGAMRGAPPPPGVVLTRLSEEEAATIYRRYQAAENLPGCSTPWERLPDATRRLLTNPLLLHLFMQAYDGRSASRVVQEVAVFRAYWDSLKRRFPQVVDAAQRVVEYMLREERTHLTDDDAHRIRAEWASARPEQEVRYLFSPLELLTCAGLARKRKEGGYAFIYQKILELLIDETLREQEGTEQPTETYWRSLAQRPAPFPEWGAAFTFLFRELDEKGQWALAATLTEEGHSYVDAAHEEFLKQLAVETWSPRRESEPFNRCIGALAQCGGLWTASVLARAAIDLHPTQYSRMSARCYLRAVEILEALSTRLGRSDLRYLLADIYYRLGGLYRATHRHADAAKAFSRYLELEDRKDKLRERGFQSPYKLLAPVALFAGLLLVFLLGGAS